MPTVLETGIQVVLQVVLGTQLMGQITTGLMFFAETDLPARTYRILVIIMGSTRASRAALHLIMEASLALPNPATIQVTGRLTALMALVASTAAHDLIRLQDLIHHQADPTALHQLVGLAVAEVVLESGVVVAIAAGNRLNLLQSFHSEA